LVSFRSNSIHVYFIVLSSGAVDATHDMDLLENHHVTHILNVTTMAMVDYPDRFIYKHISITDLPETNITASFEDCFSFIETARQSGGCVLVHCMAGVSRSATIVIAYLMKSEGMTFRSAFDHVKQHRSCICPNEGFQKQLKEFGEKLMK